MIHATFLFFLIVSLSVVFPLFEAISSLYRFFPGFLPPKTLVSSSSSLCFAQKGATPLFFGTFFFFWSFLGHGFRFRNAYGLQVLVLSLLSDWKFIRPSFFHTWCSPRYGVLSGGPFAHSFLLCFSEAVCPPAVSCSLFSTILAICLLEFDATPPLPAKIL